jgi:hypothetical protein
MKYGILAIIITTTMLAVLSCGTRQGSELTGRITFLSGEVSINEKPCSFGAPVKAGDIVATGNRSLAVLQFGESSVINLKEKTSLKIDKLLTGSDGDTITIHQKIGSTFNKIAKKGTNYSVHTQTSVAAVRGTSFTCTVSERGSAIKLSTGHVRIVPVIRGAAVETAAVDLDAGKKIETAETGASLPVDLTEREARDMKALDAIAIIPNIEKEGTLDTLKKQPEESRPVVVPVEIIQVIQAELEAESSEKRVTITLKNIQDRYGSISVITTTEGASYTGAFAQEGDQMKIFTTGGTVKVPSSKISNVSRYRGEIK